ncbi:Rid family hydrolase [Nocardiopsis alba]|uniref:Rid family hydrolase n=1 Tax=Nocardiopsis alba TaxID=53437 RepID=UPI0033B4E320
MSAGKRVEYLDVPWERGYGYAQAVGYGDTVYLSGQVSHEGEELVAPAPVEPDGRVVDFSATEAQMRQCYVNASRLLARFGASLDDVVDEVVYVVDAATGNAVAGEVRKEAYGRPDPWVASTMVGVSGLAFPELLVEVKLVARV